MCEWIAFHVSLVMSYGRVLRTPVRNTSLSSARLNANQASCAPSPSMPQKASGVRATARRETDEPSGTVESPPLLETGCGINSSGAIWPERNNITNEKHLIDGRDGASSKRRQRQRPFDQKAHDKRQRQRGHKGYTAHPLGWQRRPKRNGQAHCRRDMRSSQQRVRKLSAMSAWMGCTGRRSANAAIVRIRYSYSHMIQVKVT